MRLPALHPYTLRLSQLLVAGGVLMLTGCGGFPKSEAQSQSGSPPGQTQAVTAVDVATARSDLLTEAREYANKTQPLREVSLRSQIEGQVLRLNVDVGDRINQGQALAQIDDSILVTLVSNAEAELAARQSEVARLKTQESEAKTRVEQSRLQLQQANADAARFDQLAKDGATSQQQAEQAKTTARTTAQVVRSTEEQVRNQQAAIVAAERRVLAQQALVAQAQKRRSYAILTAPLTGVVVSRATEVGNLVQPGTELLKLGDLSSAKVLIQVDEQNVGSIKLGSSAKVRLDALPKNNFVGKVTRISPAANTLLVPVEVTIQNPTRKISSGLLARVSFEQTAAPQVIVPLSALQEDRPAQQASPDPLKNVGMKAEKPRKTEGILFVVNGAGEQATVTSRSVRLGAQADGKVEILAGLHPGERFVVRSGKPLKEGETVRISILSEK
jgi:HlyD family secretion protein